MNLLLASAPSPWNWLLSRRRGTSVISEKNAIRLRRIQKRQNSEKRKTENRIQKTENEEGELLGATKSVVVEVAVRMGDVAIRTTNAI
jgi:hypothetical protein